MEELLGFGVMVVPLSQYLLHQLIQQLIRCQYLMLKVVKLFQVTRLRYRHNQTLLLRVIYLFV